jgi:hypothetical protein
MEMVGTNQSSRAPRLFCVENRSSLIWHALSSELKRSEWRAFCAIYKRMSPQKCRLRAPRSQLLPLDVHPLDAQGAERRQRRNPRTQIERIQQRPVVAKQHPVQLLRRHRKVQSRGAGCQQRTDIRIRCVLGQLLEELLVEDGLGEGHEEGAAEHLEEGDDGDANGGVGGTEDGLDGDEGAGDEEA